jgi:hypothetical protein
LKLNIITAFFLSHPKTEIVRSRGYPAEDHDVFTDDGYILSIQRIPCGKNKSTSRIKGKIAFA